RILGVKTPGKVGRCRAKEQSQRLFPTTGAAFLVLTLSHRTARRWLNHVRYSQADQGAPGGPGVLPKG
ncbi:hypothetical protein LLE49_18455, partial [Alicyclobacillus tolerans]|uniref:hypothetical protein n=1 Tax=Alicyclobacillus tolerans TaxID=90970 RepID=UPI001F1F8D1B